MLLTHLRATTGIHKINRENSWVGQNSFLGVKLQIAHAEEKTNFFRQLGYRIWTYLPALFYSGTKINDPSYRLFMMIAQTGSSCQQVYRKARAKGCSNLFTSLRDVTTVKIEMESNVSVLFPAGRFNQEELFSGLFLRIDLPTARKPMGPIGEWCR